MKIFFDTEFTGLHKNTSLISIGLIDENGRSFYAEFTDYDKSQVNEWIENNVIKNLTHPTLSVSGNDWTITGVKPMIRTALNQWLEYYKDEQITLVSDVCHYDMVLFIDIFGGAFDLPKNICSTCYDINQDIAKYYNISLAKAFDTNREELAENLGFELQKDMNKHNSLFDAKILQTIYKGLNKRI